MFDFPFTGLSIRLQSDNLLFVTQSTNVKPTLKVDEIRLVVQFAVLQESLVRRIEQRLAQSNIQLVFWDYLFKSYALEQGRIENSINISLRDNYIDELVCFIHPNEVILGSYGSNYQLLTPHKLVHAYLSGGPLDLKIPSLPGKATPKSNLKHITSFKPQPS